MFGCPTFNRLMSRRKFFQIGGVGMFGLTWADVLRAQAADGGKRGRGRAKQAIFIFLPGGPPHQDMFDMKPEHPEAEIRGPFRPIATKVPGLQVCEHLPKLAQVADKFTILRSVNARGFPLAGGHFGGLCWKCGNRRSTAGTPKYPAYGSVVAKLVPTPHDLPGFVVLGDLNSNSPGMKENYLGPAYNPLVITLSDRPRQPKPLSTDPRQGPDFPDITRLQVNAADFERNTLLLRSLEAQLRQLDRAEPLLGAMDQFQQKAFDILRSPKLREAVDLSKESHQTKERYGFSVYDSHDNPSKAGNIYSPRVLAARRLIEAGVPFVYLDFGSWDWHGGPGQLEKALPVLASFDAAISALITDLDERGLLDTTLVVACGEMGRTPRFQGKNGYGRDHWAPAQFVFVAGGGFKRGAVVGATDSMAAYVKDNEYKVTSLGKTIYHLLGIDPDHQLYTTDNRPIRIIDDDKAPLIHEAII
ncbi:MAG: hypothetical protein KatS3mg107_0970 [Gemmataceae bacterium]|nr:MAG: hypothetical protein KatS3mg107_0970 [Gemmataceae bacterium]